MAKKINLTFEEATLKLEEIVRQLEKGNTSLDESLKLYEEGVALVRFCNNELENAEKKIKMLVYNENGEMTEKEFCADA